MQDIQKKIVGALRYLSDSASSSRYGEGDDFDFDIFRADLEEVFDEVEEELDND